jgi:ribosomal protein S27AE
MLLIDAVIPSSRIPYGNGSIAVSGFSNSPWVYVLGISVPGYGVEAVATQGRELVDVFTQYFNSGVWFILCLTVIVMVSLVASVISNSVEDAVRASVFSLTIASVLGLYYLNNSLKPALYDLSIRQTVIEDAVATLSLMIVAGTIVNIIAVTLLSGVLTYVVLRFRPRQVAVTPVKPQALEKPTEVKTEEVKKEKAPPLSTPPLCPNCGSKLVWKPKESRYYCEKCRRYPEDVYLKI